MRGDVRVHLQGGKRRQQAHLPGRADPLTAHERIGWLPDAIKRFFALMTDVTPATHRRAESRRTTADVTRMRRDTLIKRKE